MNLIKLPEDIHMMIFSCMDTLSKLKFLETIIDNPSKFEHYFTLQFFTSDELYKIFKDYTMLALSGCIKLIKLTAQLKPECEFNSDVCANAAYCGHLEILILLRTQNPPCPWDWKTCAYAAGRGNLEILQWVRTQNPPCLPRK